MSSRALLPVLAALAAMVVPAKVSAAPATQSATAEAAILSPLSVIKRADLDFGTLVVSGAGSAVIDPVTNSLSTTGGLTPSGTSAHPARFTATGSKNAVALVRLPNSPAVLTRVGGTETVTVSDWTQDGPTNRRIPITDTFDFYVGGTLDVAAGQVPGTYTGTFSITVQYP
ncbi:MAG TPA: DUF4402 domain-containing protein [Sphingomicrobium sp.]|jgi:hypothetical protein|nr:DUF4402 domain-containing protein [Sphingomicrobium sp.]